MAKLTYLSVGVITSLLALVLVFGGLGLAVREGMADEVLVWFPQRGKYQLIVRVGPNAPPWGGRTGRDTAINIWAHGRGTDWHIFRVLNVPLGEGTDETRR